MTTATSNPIETKPETPPAAPAPAAAPATAIVPAQPAAPISIGGADAEGTIDAFASMGKFRTAQAIANQLAESSLVPAEFRKNPANCLLALDISSRIGASVFAVMQNLYIISGKPSWSAKFLISTVNACGRFTALRWRWEGEKGTDSYGCRAWAKELSTGEECVGPLINWELAKAEGWPNRGGSKWRTMPEKMFLYRAAAWWADIYAPELAQGIRTVDENEDVYGPATPSAAGVAANAQSLEERLRARIPNAAPPPDVLTAEFIEEPKPAAAAEEAKPKAARAKAAKGVERDPLTGEIVPPVRESGED